ncbi:MAG: hypothetical protein R3281_00955 [Balneolaceae bacterium]|nr:hypothetical protein [Balneolaceae bacterium]
MNAAHYHLIINHLPLFSMLFGLLILTWGLTKKSDSITRIAYLLLVVGGISSYLAMETGEGAEEIVEEHASISHDAIHNHEEAAEIAFWFSLIAGGFGLAGLFTSAIDQRYQKTLAAGTFLVTLLALGSLIYTAYEGGKIRHPEAYDHQVQQVDSSESNEEYDDD